MRDRGRNQTSIVRGVQRGRRRRPPVRLRYLLLLLISVGLFYATRPPAEAPGVQEVSHSSSVIQPGLQTVVPKPVVSEHVVSEFRVKRGDTFYGILKDLGVGDDSIMALASKRLDGVSLSRLVAGRTYRVISRNDEAVEYQYEPDETRIIRVMFDEDHPAVSIEAIPYTTKLVTISGTIEDSLFRAVSDIGEEPMLAMDLSEVFAWQIDFFRDLRKGDSFKVLVEKIYRDGNFVRYGKIFSTQFVNSGTRYMAFLFQPKNGRSDYFDEEGGSLRKQFLKAPLSFRRISSGFSRRRLHPVTGKVAPHMGVDYVAPIGTPIRAIGDGKIIMKKKDSVNGRIIKIRHNSTYSSAYAHMNSFASGMATGIQVKQGQIIGYVGRSGRATGPHLHFAMYRNGRYVDPRRVNVPRASSVPKGDMEAYLRLVDEKIAILASSEHETVFSAKDSGLMTKD
jgi:murein DD-endopeptidase MepM/ murein hydrolase activator NlpD